MLPRLLANCNFVFKACNFVYFSFSILIVLCVFVYVFAGVLV